MRRVLATAVLATLLLSACSAQGGIAVTLDEYTISARPDRETAGTLTFTARNQGGIAHQLQILRTKLRADDLPVNKSGVVPADAEGVEQAGEIPIVAEGDSEPLSLELKSGRYALICNIAGHYSNGMYAAFTVS